MPNKPPAESSFRHLPAAVGPGPPQKPLSPKQALPTSTSQFDQKSTSYDFSLGASRLIEGAHQYKSVFWFFSTGANILAVFWSTHFGGLMRAKAVLLLCFLAFFVVV